MQRITKILCLSSGLLLAAGVANAGKYADTQALFRNAGESAWFFDHSYAYAEFPNIGEGGFVVGGAYG